MIDSSAFKNAMALLSGAVSVITSDGPAGRCGFTASAVCSVTDSPPTLLVCMNQASQSHGAFRRNAVLAVNVLAGAHQDLASVFASRDLSMEQRFAASNWTSLPSGAPGMDEALVCFDCRIAHHHEVGTHTVFYCEIDSLAVSDNQEALVYFNRAFHRLGAA
ncbi:flavin reductase [Pseudomonas bohemica]|uniref:flavin reductase n=1 Tax=Pseudomonas bohemica TaxID=2044872 RepID=UPI000DA61B93|nr:flavin reductase [Pseudomonas bohemica]